MGHCIIVRDGEIRLLQLMHLFRHLHFTIVRYRFSAKYPVLLALFKHVSHFHRKKRLISRPVFAYGEKNTRTCILQKRSKFSKGIKQVRGRQTGSSFLGRKTFLREFLSLIPIFLSSLSWGRMNPFAGVC